MRRCTMRAHLRLMTLSLMVMHACRRASRRPSNAARSCARRGPARNVLFCLQTLKNGTLTHPSLWEDYCFLILCDLSLRVFPYRLSFTSWGRFFLSLSPRDPCVYQVAPLVRPDKFH